jgi:hypothetical protein
MTQTSNKLRVLVLSGRSPRHRYMPTARPLLNLHSGVTPTPSTVNI